MVREEGAEKKDGKMGEAVCTGCSRVFALSAVVNFNQTVRARTMEQTMWSQIYKKMS